MPKISTFLVLFSIFSSFTILRSQTILNPGDIIMLSMASNMGACGLPVLSDEISFVCFKDIETGTTFDMTDNGWEAVNAGFWDDYEGTLSITRTGGIVPRGTVITLQCINNGGGNWAYRIISPDNQWTITNINVPGGPFNMDDGDQIYWMQGGIWDNQGGFTHRARYDGGRIIFGGNSTDRWIADGTFNHSNLHPGALPCYYNIVSLGLTYFTFVEYGGPMSETDHFGWLERMGPQYWNNYGLCPEWESSPPSFSVGASIEIEENMGLDCAMCTGCTPWEEPIIFILPDVGEYDVVYTNGVDTFTAYNFQNGDYIPTLIDTNEISYYMISVEESGGVGCKVYSNFILQADITATYNNPGVYTEIEICSTYNGALDFNMWLQGNPDTGGTWYPTIAFNQYYYTQFGDGQFFYVFLPDPEYCEPDTASIRIIFVGYDETTYEVECDVNGTPNDITDDVMIVTMTVDGGDPAFPQYSVTVDEGTITPISGVMGEPTQFRLGPGSAVGEGVTITIHGFTPLDCFWDVFIEPTGFCSDPCTYDMISTVVGPEDLCVRNCPDNPETMFIEIEGGTEPYKVDFSLTAPGYPAWNFNSIHFEDETTIEVCIDNVPAPIYNPNTLLLTIPQFLANNSVTFTLEEVYDVYDCIGDVDPFEFVLNVHAIPPISTTALKWCSEQSHDVDLTEYTYLISNIYDVSWYDGNPLLGGDLIYNPTAVDFDLIQSLWAYVSDDYCENAIQVPYQIFPTPDLDPVPPIEICPGTPVVLQSIPLVDQGNSMATYTFHLALPPDTSNMINPLFFIPPDSMTIYVHASTPECYDTLPIQINVQPIPTFLLEGQPCNLLNSTYGIVFTTNADSIATTYGTVINNPTGQDTITGIPNDSAIVVRIFNASGLCMDEIVIVAPNCNCPIINQPAPPQSLYEICEGEPLPLLSVMIDGGLQANWYTVPSGGVAFLQNSLSYQPNTPANVTYYVEALDPANGCYSIRTAITLQINPEADLQPLADPTGCQGITIDFNTLAPSVLNGVSGSGQWFNLPNNQPVSGTIVPANGNSWYYVYTATAGSCVSSDTIVATVNPLPAINLYDILCVDSELEFDLFFTSDATTILASAGTLNQIGGTDSFSLFDIAYDTDIQFNLQNDLTGCSAVINQAAPDCSCPPLLQDNSSALCSSAGVLDLTAFVGPGASGTWQLVSTPPGGNPATLSGTNFDGQNADAGDYRLLFIRNIILDNCVDSAFFDLELTNAPTADAGTDGTVCAPDQILLSGTVTGTNVVFAWQENGFSFITNPNALNTTYLPTAADLNAGSVTFTLTATDPTGACPNAQESITMAIDDSAYYILNPSAQVYCDTSDILVDLDALISFGVTSGEWFFPDTVNAPITGSSIFNPSTLSAGTYTIFYTSTTAVAPCKDDTTAVSLIIENCACPSVALNTPADGLCSESGSVNLNSYLITTEPGTWSISGIPPGTKPATLAGSVFTTNLSDPGTYTIRFTLTNPVSGCDAFAEINLDVIASPVLTLVSVSCADDLQSWEAVVQSNVSTISASQGTVVPLGGNQYRVDNITLLTTIQFSASSGNGLCTRSLDVTAPDCECKLAISSLPDFVTLCPEDNITLEPDVTDGKGNVTSFWIVSNDSLYQNNLVVSQAGSYQFVSIDSLGCKDQHTVDVSYYIEMSPDVSTQDVQCPGDADGIIFLNAILGGNGPYFIAINGGTSQQIISFPYSVNNLSAGSYQVVLSDGFNCSVSFTAVISSASSETLSLGPDQTILVGDTVSINPLLSFVPDTFYWTGDIGLLNEDELFNVISPDDDQTMQLTAIDAKGCLYKDELFIRVLLESSIYVPNIFSPNGDGINDLLFPVADPSIVRFDYFEVFDRWGELVYSIQNFVPGQGDAGWNGNLNGETVNPAVFVYRVAGENKRGTRIVKFGDVTLFR